MTITEGKWNGGFAPYGYKIVDGVLEIEEKEAEAIRLIFDKYVNTSMGANGVAKYLLDNNIEKLPRQNGNKPRFDAHLVRAILCNPAYNGKIAYGRRKSEKVAGSRGKQRLVKQDSYEVYEGLHEAIIDDDTWKKTQAKIKLQSKKYERVDTKSKREVHILSGLLKCPKCGAGLYGGKSRARKKDGSFYPYYHYYSCKHRLKCDGIKCNFSKQIKKDILENTIEELIGDLVSNPKVVKKLNDLIDLKTDTVEIDDEIEKHKRVERQYQIKKDRIASEIDNLDIDDVHYDSKVADLKERHDKMYDQLSEVQAKIEECWQIKKALEHDKFSKDNIYNILLNFKNMYSVMSVLDKKNMLNALIKEVVLYEDKKPNGRWIKNIIFKFPVIPYDIPIFSKQNERLETVVSLSHKKADSHINVNVEFGDEEGQMR